MFVLVLRDWLKGRRIEAVFPSWRDQTQVKLDKQKYPGRNVVELCIGWLKNFRRVATRYEKPMTFNGLDITVERDQWAAASDR